MVDLSSSSGYTSRVTKGSKIAEYIWLGGHDMDIRSKCITIPEDTDPNHLSEWNYDGSSTNQASGHDSEIILKPRRAFDDPFRLGKHLLVLCDTYLPDGTRTKSNFRSLAEEVFEECAENKTWYGIEQEYVLYNRDKTWPLGFPRNGYPGPQGPYYCGVGSDSVTGRQIMNEHYNACLHAGIKISGTNAEVMPGQWEFQVGPCEGISIGDELWLARYLLLRVAENHNVSVSWDPKPILSDSWNGSGCHTNYSTKETRDEGGYHVLLNYIESMKATHSTYISLTGIGNHKRMSGKCETSDLQKFSSGVADRGASVRIPRITEKNQKGYLEDRRPGSNIDPYIISSALASITLLNGKHLGDIEAKHKEFLATFNN
jgi:glutamine synthetase